MGTELKHNFIKGRMNKDLDERLVPDGEYRDALNVEVSTSEGSNVGAVQTTMGNIGLSSIPVQYSTKCVGKILDEKNDKLYWLISESGNRPPIIYPQPVVFLGGGQLGGGLAPPPGVTYGVPQVYGDFYIADIIAEYDDINKTVNPVVVDTFYTACTLKGYDRFQGESSPDAQDGGWISVSSTSWVGSMNYSIYPGMEIDCIDDNGNQVFPPGTVVINVDVSGWQVELSNPPINPTWFDDYMTANFPVYNSLVFRSNNRFLNFQNDNLITGINIVDDFLFWTDNNSEPKKINIRRGKKEREINPYGLPTYTAPDWKTHSMLTITDTISLTPNTLKIAIEGAISSSYPTALVPMKEEHATVIRKSPLTSLNLEIRNSPRAGAVIGTLNYSNPSGACIDTGPGCTNANGLVNVFPDQTITSAVAAPNNHNPFWDYGAGVLDLKDTAWVEFGGPNSPIDQQPLSNTGFSVGVPIYNVGDALIIQTITTPAKTIRAKVLAGPDPQHGSYNLDILTGDPQINDLDEVWDVELEQPKPFFEFKFPRFSFRYKYEDGEYSAFAPFSEIAFLPDKFDYLPKKGFNLGMTNNLRKLVIKDFVDDKLLPPDVISIDILYKESGSPNIYTVKTITRDDFEWDAISETTQAPSTFFTSGISIPGGVHTGTRGYVNIESEMIHAVVPSNQFLRPWDNVPRKALAQEMTGNRLVYGNYLQNYDMRTVSGDPIKINLQLGIASREVGADQFTKDLYNYTPEERLAENAYRYNPAKSIKTLRTYQLGVVYRDKYGRETPVFSTSTRETGGDFSKASLSLEKSFADKQNKLKCWIKSEAPAWAETFKFFIKETSNEYYNLCMDRWYDAEDENIWLAFPSSERNKVDTDTFLILKKEADNADFVKEPARYKILAIENEAPTFVKTTEQIFGRVTDSGAKDTFSDGGGSLGFPVEDRNYCYAEKGAFEAVGFKLSLVDAGKPNLYMRMRTANSTSNWYKIKGFSLIAAATYYRIDFDELFGPDMNITTTDPNNIGPNTIIAGLQMEIKQNVIEHKPEFDGRFFVKIHKDQLLTEKIIKPSLLNVDYMPVDGRNFSYINSGGTPRNPSNSYSAASGKGDPFWNNPNDWVIGNSMRIGEGWNNGSNGNQLHLDGLASSRDFWGPRRGWFIDQATGYGSCGWDTNNSSAYAGWQLVCGPTWGSSIANDIGGLGISNMSGGNSGGWDINVSYTKFGNHQYNQGAGDYWRSLWHDNSTVAETAFIEKLSTPGTLWRWEEDPDKHIYETQPGGDTWGPSFDMMNGAPIGRHLYNFHYWHDGKAGTDNHYLAWINRNHFRIRASRLFDGAPMGAPGGLFNAEYTPVNDPAANGWFDDNGVNLAKKGTCTDTAFDNDPQECIDADGSFSFDTNAFFSNGATGSGVAALTNTSPPTALTQSSNHPNSFAPGIRQDGDCMGGGCNGCGNYSVNDDVAFTQPDPGQAATHWNNQASQVTWVILEPITRGAELENASANPAIWETEPKEDIGLDIYHEVGQVYPIEINNKTNDSFAPVGSTVGCWRPGVGSIILGGGTLGTGGFWMPPIKVRSWNDNIVTLEDSATPAHLAAQGRVTTNFNGNLNFPDEHAQPGDILYFTRPDGSQTEAVLQFYGVSPYTDLEAYEYKMERDVHRGAKVLPWFNCYSFGNGVESDRVRDDYNQVKIDNGPKASTTLEEPYLEERRGSGFIWSGIYNSTSGINNLNQFLIAEKITKDLNPTYGSIQKLHSRNTDLVTLCEDKVLKVLANKDALFNADGDTNLTASKNVLGQTTPFAGEFGISKNPESFASESFRVYFADKSRGAVLRLSQDGLTPISSVGMKDWFSDNLKNAKTLIGTYDDRKSTYNLTIKPPSYSIYSQFYLGPPTTISFSEKAKGWSSFKSFIPENGESLNNNYYTFQDGNIWRHHDDNVDRNSFYDAFGLRTHDSTVNFLFNDDPGSVKSYGTLNYEGSQARITENLTDNEYYNNQTVAGGAGLGIDGGNLTEFGWYVSNVKTNLQEIDVLEFKDKEGKWFSYPKGVTTELSNVDTREFSVQGIDNCNSVDMPPLTGCMDNTTVNGCGLGCNGALNYDLNASIPCGGCCVYCIWGCMTGSTTFPQINVNYDPNATCDDPNLCIPCVYGCMTSTATNFNPLATCEDGSCLGCVYGCTDPLACNYNPLATCDDDTCNTVYGCIDDGSFNQTWWAASGYMNAINGWTYSLAGATNHDPLATCDDGSCNYCVRGCTYGPNGSLPVWNSLINDGGSNSSSTWATLYSPQTAPTAQANNYDPNATCDDGTCNYCVYGCTTGSLFYPQVNVNYDPNATCDDGSCEACVYGCTNPAACNYDANATCDDGSCVLPPSSSLSIVGTNAVGIGSPDELFPDASGAGNANLCASPDNAGVSVYPFDPNETMGGGHATTNSTGWSHTESYQWTIGDPDPNNPNALVPGQSYCITWAEILLKLTKSNMCSDCTMGGWAIRMSDTYTSSWGSLTYLQKWDEINNATQLYDPVAGTALYGTSPGGLITVNSQYSNSTCATDDVNNANNVNSAGAPNGSHSEWQEKCVEFVCPVGKSEVRIHFYTTTDFTQCTGCGYNPGQNQWGAYMGVSKVRISPGCSGSCNC